MDEAPKKPAWHALPAVIVAVSIILLADFTFAQAGRQREIMASQIRTQDSSIMQSVRIHEPDFWSDGRMLLGDMLFFQINTHRDIQAVAMIFDQNDQLVATATAGKQDKHLAQLQARLEEATASEDAFWGLAFWGSSSNMFRINYYGTYRRRSDGNYSDGVGFIMPAPDDNESKPWYIFAAECYPFRTAMLQLIPVYLLTALLLIALALAKKKALSRGNQCPTSPNPT